MTTVSSKEVLQAIFNRYDGPEWVRFAEVASGTGAGRHRRADAICMNIWPSQGYAIHGFEIKVSRADFIREMKVVAKAEEIAQYCDFWWLATPVGLVKPDEVPASWGLIELCKNGMRIKKQAPKRDAPGSLPKSFMSAMLRKSRDTDDAYISAQMANKEEQLRKRIENEYAYRQPRIAKQAEQNAEWIRKFEEVLGRPFVQYEPPEAIAQRLKVAESIEFGAISRLMVGCASVVKEVGDLGKAMKDGREESA